MNKKLIVIGAGGHAKVLIECAKKCGLTIFGATSLIKKQETILGVNVLNDEQIIFQYGAEQVELINGVGMLPGENKQVRYEIFERFNKLGFKFVTLVHPSAVLAEELVLSEGTQVMAGVVIQPSVSIGDNTIINTSASIDHDCIIGKHCHIAPGVTLSGGVVVKDHVHIGTGATVIQGITIGENSVIAAGAVVYKDVPSNITYLGRVK